MPKKQPAKKTKAKCRPIPTLPGDVEHYAILVAGGMKGVDAVRLIMASRGEAITPTKAKERAHEWRKKTASRVEQLQLAAAKATELTCGITKASQIAWYKGLRDCVVTKENAATSIYIEKIKITTRTSRDGTTETTMEAWVPSKLGAAKQIDVLLGFESVTQADDDQEDDVEPAGMSIADFMAQFHRAGTPIAHRREDAAAGRIIELSNARNAVVTHETQR